jgi:hypothetical protein
MKYKIDKSLLNVIDNGSFITFLFEEDGVLLKKDSLKVVDFYNYINSDELFFVYPSNEKFDILQKDLKYRLRLLSL